MKPFKAFAALCAALVLTISMTGCEMLTKKTGTTPSQQSSSQSSEKTTPVETVEKYHSLKDCIEDPEVKAELDAMKQEADDGSYKLEIFVENEINLVFEYNYIAEEISEEQRPAMKQSIESTLSRGSYAVYYTTLAADLQHDVGDKNITVIVRYLDKTGYVLGEHEYVPVTSKPDIN